MRINDEKVTDWNDVVTITSQSNGKALGVTIKRGLHEQLINVTPQIVKGQNIFGEEIKSYKIGIVQSDQLFIRKQNPIRAMWSGLEKTWAVTELTVVSLIKMIQGVVSPKTLGRPNPYRTTRRCSSKARNCIVYLLDGALKRQSDDFESPADSNS